MAERGYWYWVSDDQLRTFAAQPVERRLDWLEEMRQVTFELATPEVRERWWQLRREARGNDS